MFSVSRVAGKAGLISVRGCASAWRRTGAGGGVQESFWGLTSAIGIARFVDLARNIGASRSGCSAPGGAHHTTRTPAPTPAIGEELNFPAARALRCAARRDFMHASNFMRRSPCTVPLYAFAFLAVALTAQAQAPAPTVRQVGTARLENVPEIPAQVSAAVQRYQNDRAAIFEDWLPDGSMLIATRFGASQQIHRVTAPGGARTQLTFFTEPVAAALYDSGDAALRLCARQRRR